MTYFFVIGLLLFSLASDSFGQQQIGLFDAAKEEKDLRDAQEELKLLERRIQRKDIPPIEFEFNKAVLKERSKDTLDLIADLLFKYPTFKLFISGHTCDIGSPQYNEMLSQKRASAVKDYLVSIGLLGEFIKAKGYGETKPIADNDTEEGRMQNRRVEFQIMTRNWSAVY